MSTAAGPGEQPAEGSAGEGSGQLDEDVLAMVRRQLDRDPPPSTAALYGRAARINRDIYELSLRQFHAKYPLRVKREQARRERETARSSGPASGGEGADAGPGGVDPGTRDRAGAPDAAVDDDAGRRHLFGADADGEEDGEDPRRSGTAAERETRQRVRRVFLRFAREVAEAERPERLMGVAERLPDRVDEIARIVGPVSPDAEG